MIPVVSPPLRAGGNETGGDRPPGTDVDTCESLVPSYWDGGQVTATLDASNASKQQAMPEKDRFMAVLEPVVFESRFARNGRGAPEEICPPLKAQSGETGKGDAAPLLLEPIAFTAKDHGADAGAIAPTQRGGGHDASHANGGVMPAVAFNAYQRSVGAVHSPLTSESKGRSETGVIVPAAFKASHFTRGKDGAPDDVAPPLSADADKGDQDTLVGPVAFEPRYYTRENKTGGGPSETVQLNATGAAKSGDAAPCVAFAQNQRDEVRQMDVAGALAAEPGAKQQTYVQAAMHVRRLTPRECERLQGFPDDYTLVPMRGKPAADGPRYKALGNSFAVPVVAWIGRRLAAALGPR